MTVLLSRAELKEKIVEAVSRKQGCKATELCTEKELVLAKVLEGMKGMEKEPTLPELIQELIDEGRLVEVEYVLPQLSFRAKSFLLPVGSKVSVNGSRGA